MYSDLDTPDVESDLFTHEFMLEHELRSAVETLFNGGDYTAAMRVVNDRLLSIDDFTLQFVVDNLTQR